MTAFSSHSEFPPQSELNWLRRIGGIGTALALAILGASMLLRLTTAFSVDGQAYSTLPPVIEQATRLLHRLAAAGVGLLAMFAVAQSWKHRKNSVQPAGPTFWIVGMTVILAVVGPLTPGYKLSAITVVNVGCGMLLLMAFWWLRESIVAASASVSKIRAIGVFSWTALLFFVLHVGTGAAASAWEMKGVRWPAFVHLGSLIVCIILIGKLVILRRRQYLLIRYTTAVEVIFVMQFLTGYVLMWQDQRAVILSFLHGMLSPALAMALVSLLQRNRHSPDP